MSTLADRFKLKVIVGRKNLTDMPCSSREMVFDYPRRQGLKNSWSPHRNFPRAGLFTGSFECNAELMTDYIGGGRAVVGLPGLHEVNLKLNRVGGAKRWNSNSDFDWKLAR